MYYEEKQMDIWKVGKALSKRHLVLFAVVGFFTLAMMSFIATGPVFLSAIYFLGRPGLGSYIISDSYST